MNFWKQLKSLAGERGQVLVVFAILLPLLIGGLGLSIDIGSAMLNRTQAQKAADAAAIAGADFKLKPSLSASTPTACTPTPDILAGIDCEARFIAQSNGYTGTDTASACAGQTVVCVFTPVTAINCGTDRYT